MKVQRLHYVDILKILVISLVFLIHIAMIFSSSSSSYIKDNFIHSELATSFVQLFWQWTMSLMFFLAGISVFYSLKSKDWKQFVVERLKRLYIPLIAGTLGLVSVQTYILAKTQFGFQGSFVEFFATQFFNGTGISPAGYFNWGHLWFVSYLFHFSLLALPFFMYVLKDSKPVFVTKVLSIVKKGSIFLPLILLILVECILRPTWPGNLALINDWANFFSFLIVFIYGFLYAADFIRSETSKAFYPYFLLVYLLSAACMFFYSTTPDAEIGYNANFILSRVLAAFNAWASIIFLIDVGKNRVNFSNRFFQYASHLTMPFYLLHYLVLTLVGYAVVQLQAGLAFKILLILIPSFVITMGLCEILRHIPVFRFLLGLK